MRAIDETGKRYKRLIVLERAGSTKSGTALWRCKCDCGNETITRGEKLRNGSTTSCGCRQVTTNCLPFGVAALRRVFRHIKRNAKKHGYQWKLSDEDIKQLIDSPCHYCGVESSNISRGIGNNGDYHYNGIDRVDNQRGYLPDNVVACCWECNQAKGAKSYHDFIEWIRRIANHIGG